MKNYLITGVAGTGKSAVGQALASKGYRVLETDRVPENMAVYRKRFDARTGKLSAYQRGDGWDELQHVRWQIDVDILRPKLVGPKGETQFVCGYADNWSELKDDFDGIFLLQASPAMIKDRLLNRTTGDWGRKHPEELKHTLETAQRFNDSIKNIGATILNANQSVDDVVNQISESIEQLS